ncbi:MAG: xaa-pro aminopeptidase, partial [Deltaproteobacteria bacterium]|nr:xaa-pro aminopeptidase [Deltaproteobacteria bacterium]
PFIAATHTYPIEDGAVFAIEPKMVWPRKGCCGYENTVHYANGKCRIITDIDDNIIIA